MVISACSSAFISVMPSMRSSTNGAVEVNSTGGAKVLPALPSTYIVASSLSARLTARIAGMPATTIVMSLTAASGPSPSRLRSTATAPCADPMHCAEISDNSQNAASNRGEVSLVMITATFARLPSSPCSSSSNFNESSAALSMSSIPEDSEDSASSEASEESRASDGGLSARSCLDASASLNSCSKPAIAASNSSSLKCMPSALGSPKSLDPSNPWKSSKSLFRSSLITERPSCSEYRRHADPARWRNEAHVPRP